MDVIIVGTGNVAYHLVKGFKAAQVEIKAVLARDRQSVDQFCRDFPDLYITTDWQTAPRSDLYILAVSDSAIAQVASRLRQKPLVHTAGAVGPEVLSFYTPVYGVFYPFQTFRKVYEIDWQDVPIFIEACCFEFEQKLFTLAQKLSNNVFYLNSEKRQYLHLAGVLVNNFVNHLLAKTYRILQSKGLDYRWIYPLLEKTVENAKNFDPAQIQTGPAVRNDNLTIQKHLRLIDDPHLRRIYQAISQSIQEFTLNHKRDDKSKSCSEK